MRRSFALSIMSLSLPAVSAGAQACNKGPGSAFGVTGYTCTECSVEWDNTAVKQYTFHSELVVLKTTSTSALRNGDIIEAIDNRPITTRDGAALFATPPAGRHTLTVRRNRARTEVRTDAVSCDGDQPNSDEWVRVDKLVPLRYRAQNDTTREFTINKVEPAPSESQSTFGFAVACIPMCVKVRPEGKLAYWKYDNYPQIAAVRAGGPAERAGLRNGDVVTKVDGFSVLEEKGALKLFQSEGAATLNLTVLREGKELAVVLHSKPD